jgi:hypothetical protein
MIFYEWEFFLPKKSNVGESNAKKSIGLIATRCGLFIL